MKSMVLFVVSLAGSALALGTLGCNGDGVGGRCGDGVVQQGEDCDASALGGASCQSLGFAGGTLSCSQQCAFDTGGCTEAGCGNSLLDAGEHCDGSELGGTSCQSLGFAGGTLSCSAQCTFDTAGCTGAGPDCGNGVREAGEQCDGQALGGASCESLGFEGGELACTGQCAYDTSGCEGEGCGDGVIGTGEQCDGAALGGETCASQGHDGGTLACTGQCTFDESGCCDHGCAAAGDTRCQGSWIQTCQLGPDGCRLWQDTQDCSSTGQQCHPQAGGAVCGSGCADECNQLGDERCSGTRVERCTQGGDGCLDWTLHVDCSSSGQTCSQAGNTATCVSNVPGDSCGNPQSVQLPHFSQGTDLTADFSDSGDFGAGAGCDTASGVEAIFEVTLAAGETIHIAEGGAVDVVVRVLDTCAAGSACLLSFDFGETDGQTFTAPAAGTYYVVFEAYFASPYNTSYMFSIARVETQCNDGQDNDGDYQADCADPDCFGPACAPETQCEDNLDNDGDGDIDYDDADCIPANDTCAAPLDISGGGSFSGDTTGAAADYDGGAGWSCGPDVTYELTLASAQMVTFSLTVDDPDPMASNMEVDYNVFVGSPCPPADAGWGSCFCASDSDPWCSPFPATMEKCERLAAGTHYAVVQAGSPWGYPPNNGAPFTLDVSLANQPTLACGALPDVSAGGAFLLDPSDPRWVNARGSCGTYGTQEALFTLDLASTTNVALTTPQRSGSLYLLSACDASAASLGYGLPQVDLPAGSYIVVKELGSFSGTGSSYLNVQLASPGSACQGAIPITATGSYSGTTAGGQNQIVVSSSRGHGPEVVYEVQLSAQTRVVADLIADAAFNDPMLYFQGDCMISDTVDFSSSNPTHQDEVLPAGNHLLVVDGRNVGDEGGYVLNVTFMAP